MGHQSLQERCEKLAAAAHNLKQESGILNVPFSLAFITDRTRIRAPETVINALPPDSAIIYRDYDDENRENEAQRLLEISRKRGIFFLLAGSLQLAKQLGADGVHLRSDQLHSKVTIPQIGLLTAACHNADELDCAKSLGADVAFLSPVFPTNSHPNSNTLGPDRFRKLTDSANLPVLALGGVDESNAHLLGGRNVCGFAAISAFSPEADNC